MTHSSMSLANPQRPLSRPAKAVVPIVGALLVSGCVVASTALWRSNITDPVAARSIASAMSSDGTIYQGYHANDNIWLRKVDTAGVTLWQQAITPGTLSALVPANDGSVLMIHGGRLMTLVDSAGTAVWTREVAPASTTISSWSQLTGERIHLGYTSAAAAGIVALDLQGDVVWSHVLDNGGDDGVAYRPQMLAVFNSGKVLAKLLVESIEAPFTREGQLYAFDSDGALVQTHDTDFNTRLLDNRNSAFLQTGGEIRRVDETGNQLWTHSFSGENFSVSQLYCAGDQDLEIACAYTVYEPDVRFDNIVAWLNADGDVRNERSSLVITTNYQHPSRMYYAGNDTWILQRDANQDLATIPLLLSDPEEKWQTLQVLQDDGTLQKTLIMRSTITSWYLCSSDIFQGCQRTNRTGDSISNVLADDSQLYVIGNRGAQGFISSYALD